MLRIVLFAVFLSIAGSYSSQAGLQLVTLDTCETGIFDDRDAEIVAYDARSRYLFVVNASEDIVEILDIKKTI